MGGPVTRDASGPELGTWGAMWVSSLAHENQIHSTSVHPLGWSPLCTPMGAGLKLVFLQWRTAKVTLGKEALKEGIVRDGKGEEIAEEGESETDRNTDQNSGGDDV